MQPESDAMQAVAEVPAAGSSPPTKEQRESKYKKAIASSLLVDLMKPQRSGLINPVSFMRQYMQ